MKRWATTLLILIISLSFQQAFGQKTIKGIVKDSHSEEPIPFASFVFKGTEIGGSTDSSGSFGISSANWPSDTLIFTNVGYQPYKLAVKNMPDSLYAEIAMERRSYTDGVIVKVKINKGLYLWRQIVKHKPENNRFARFDNFSYELYNKLELDIKNLKSVQKITKIKPFRPLNDLINKNIDTSEGIKVLPAYLTEVISDYYYQRKPLKRREEIIAVNTNGIKNESMIKYLGGMDQVVNVYNNFIDVFDKEYVSPASDNGDFYYNYVVADTQHINNKSFFHLIFAPRRHGMNAFEGDCWVEAGSFAIQKLNLRLDKAADINFLQRLSLIQEYSKINDSTWFIYRDKFVADFAPVGKLAPGVIGRKTTTYKNVLYDNDSITRRLALNTKLEEVITLSNAGDRQKPYWDTARHESLSKTEAGIIKMIDTLMNSSTYQRITKQVRFLTTGYFDWGNVELGSAYNWFSGNSWEGFRMRFDAASNKYFNTKLRWHAYLAYGFKDKDLKGRGELFYLPKKDPRQYWYLGYKNDLDFGQNYYGEISQDNIFAFAVRKPGIPIKFIKQETKTFEFFNEWRSGFSVLTSFNNKIYTPLSNLLPASTFGAGKNPLNTTEVAVRLRFAYLEKFLETTFFRYSLGSPYPITELTFTKGVSGILGSRYNYSKLSGSISDYFKLPPFGDVSFQVYGGRVFGTLPYTFLEVAPGNELYYYNKYALNMMNRYEFIHDRYMGINYEHNIGNGIFKLFPRLKFRQFYTVKTLWGSLDDANKQLNFVNGHNFQSLDGKTYMEIGTGVDNILRFLRVDFIWRVLPKNGLNDNTKRFGIFGSIRFNL